MGGEASERFDLPLTDASPGNRDAPQHAKELILGDERDDDGPVGPGGKRPSVFELGSYLVYFRRPALGAAAAPNGLAFAG